jgi:type IV pilus assembly protein PilF
MTLRIVALFTFFFLSACVSLDSAVTTPNLNAANDNVQLGLLYLQREENVNAKEKLLLALQQAPNWPTALDAMAFYFESTGDQNQAGYYYRRALKSAPNSGQVLNNYGVFLCRHGAYQLAVPYFLKAAYQAEYVNTAAAYENAGLCLMAKGDITHAELYFSKAITQDPKRLKSFLALAKISFLQEKYHLSSSYLKRYLQLTKPNPQSHSLMLEIGRKLRDNRSIKS